APTQVQGTQGRSCNGAARAKRRSIAPGSSAHLGEGVLPLGALLLPSLGGLPLLAVTRSGLSRPLRFARGLEGIAFVPVRPGSFGRQGLSDLVERLQVFDDSVVAPAVVDLVAGAVVAAGIFGTCDLASPGSAVDQVTAALGIERGHACLGEIEMVR